MPKLLKETSKNPLGYQKLETFGDYASLVEKVINGVLDGTIPRQDAHSVAILTGYGIQAIRESNSGKMRMSVFLQDVHKNSIRFESMSRDEIDRFLQGDESIQLEVLQQVQEKSGMIRGEIKALPLKKSEPLLNKKLISNMSGVPEDQVREVLTSEVESIELERRPVHKWGFSAGGDIRFCSICGLEKERLQPEDAESVCSGEWSVY